MNVDARDAVTIEFASFGALLGALVGFVVGEGDILLWWLGGAVFGSALAAFSLS